MFTAQSIPAEHKDLVHDVAYDFYGRRFASCSSDQIIKVWDLNDNDEWYCSSSFKAHSGSVWKVCWAHPEFGQILATCSFDRTVAVWEEKLDGGSTGSSSPSSKTAPSSQSSDAGTSKTASGSSSWVRRALLVDSRSSITDVKFAPRHLGLLLATCSSDGTLRIYEAPDIMNLSQWNPQHDINCRMSCSCLSWNPSPFHAPMIAVGSDEPASSFSATSSGLDYDSSFNFRSSSMNSPVASHNNQMNLQGRIQLYESSDNTRRWILVEVITSIVDPVYDLSFASSVGKDYHLLGVASNNVQILSIREPTATGDHSLHHSIVPGGGIRDDRSITSASNVSLLNSYHNYHHLESQAKKDSGAKFDITCLGAFDDHRSRVWRLSWNMTGTILASSGEDACIRLWKSNYLDAWKSIGVIRMDGASEAGGLGLSSSGTAVSSFVQSGQCLSQQQRGIIR